MADPDRPFLACVIGWPVMHSLSPLMHSHWMEQQGIKGGYVPILVRPGTLEPALRALHPLGFAGCNLTIPHKLDAMEIVDEVDDVARRIGAISCIVVREDGALFGTNNDWLGFLGNLKQSVPGWRGDAGPAVVIGAGGGARAVCHGLLREGVPEIRLVNRTAAKAEKVAADLGGSIRVLPWKDRHIALEGAALAVNTTSLGMVGQPPLDLKLDCLHGEAVAADIVYTPLETAFLQAARARGNPIVDGLGMLMHQGPAAWRRWLGVEPLVTDDLRRALEDRLKRH
ncbi:shikimate dehydrogenase [Roseibium marinum]|uniref:Shikimate dehydrogenase (NADP(+)) n=1 Tax=Roseibium marinum TaxID=281252 RepID=A0A2S3V432_9HYPH|nr:shikimate dehydrogenase [Roseibium marinum]POF34533.1 shikimate dehydrogenase [Roseibium marinum]